MSGPRLSQDTASVILRYLTPVGVARVGLTGKWGDVFLNNRQFWTGVGKSTHPEKTIDNASKYFALENTVGTPGLPTSYVIFFNRHLVAGVDIEGGRIFMEYENTGDIYEVVLEPSSQQVGPIFPDSGTFKKGVSTYWKDRNLSVEIDGKTVQTYPFDKHPGEIRSPLAIVSRKGETRFFLLPIEGPYCRYSIGIWDLKTQKKVSFLGYASSSFFDVGVQGHQIYMRDLIDDEEEEKITWEITPMGGDLHETLMSMVEKVALPIGT